MLFNKHLFLILSKPNLLLKSLCNVILHFYRIVTWLQRFEPDEPISNAARFFYSSETSRNGIGTKSFWNENKNWKSLLYFTLVFFVICGQFHQHFMRSFYACRSKKHQKDSQVKQLFAILGSACIKAARKHIDEIDPWSLKVL